MQTPAKALVMFAMMAGAASVFLAACSTPAPEKPTAPAKEIVPPAETPAPSPDASATTQAAPPAQMPEVAHKESKPKPAASKPVVKPAPEPAPPVSEAAPPPKPEPIAKTVAAGTDLDVEFLDGVSSKTSHVGDSVRARVAKAVLVDGMVVIPVGTIAMGTVTEAIPLKKIGGQASLGLKFESLDLPGASKTAIEAKLHEQGKSETGKDAGTIAGATAGGALLGRLLSHSKTKGTLIGAVVGAAAGAGIAAGTKGQEVELPAGTPVAIHLDAPLTGMVQPEEERR